MQSIHTQELAERPPDYVGPNLNPEGLFLEPRTLAEGVHALMANELPKDNNGLVSGERAALVVDAGINPDISHQIQRLARRLTDSPVRYLVNTTYHGDHTFGNSAFPDDVVVLSSRLNRESMRDLAQEKRNRAGNLRGNLKALDDVTEWRRPDVVFERHLEIDLGGRKVQLWHFGPGNAPGDTVVYVPSARVAWTGNYLPAAGIPPMLLEGGPRPYIESLRRMQRTLDVETIVPGHGPMGAARPALENLIAYLEELGRKVGAAVEAGRSLAEILADYPTSALLRPPEGVPPTPAMKAMAPHLHRLNVLATYRARVV